MKIIFLDFDGVLNSMPWLHYSRDLMEKIGDPENPSYFAQMLDPSKVKLLNYIIEETGARIVISSSWRRMHSMERIQEMLEIQGFEYQVLDRIPTEDEFQFTRRGEAINYWLDNHSEVQQYVIIDDDIDAYMRVFVKTGSFSGGLTFNKALRCIDILNGG